MNRARRVVLAGVFAAVGLSGVVHHVYWRVVTDRELSAIKAVLDRLHDQYPDLHAGRSTHEHPVLIVTGRVATAADRDSVRAAIAAELPGDAAAAYAAGFIRVDDGHR